MTTAVRRTSRWTPIGVAATVLGFAVWWPLGLGVIGYILWGGSVDDLINDGFNKVRGMMTSHQTGSSGNAAFDEYRRETLRRLEEEQAEFDEYVTNLRRARDREEFERFMADRASKTSSDL
jgi:hypothetical protein